MANLIRHLAAVTPRLLLRHPRAGEDPLASTLVTPAPTTRHPRPFDRLRAGSGGDLLAPPPVTPALSRGRTQPPHIFVDNLLTVLGPGGSRPVSRGVWRKKAKKQKKFSQNPLPGAKNCSIIGLTLGKGVAEAREAAGKIEGIGDVLSDGSKNFLGKSIRT